MITALVSTSFGDGNFSESEKGWIRGHFLTLNYPEEFIEKAMSESATNLASVVLLMHNPKLERAKKIMLYDALRAASTDGIHEGEVKLLKKLASVMDVPKEEVDAIEELVKQEEEMKVRRIKLLGLDKFSALADKYKTK
mmetsp:Transcript_16704/g.31330  ORF Transcript_16704/g.31330 Transcript_16704/m.31330 type:complete len:139 (+) Transcript_16704:2-418(+)